MAQAPTLDRQIVCDLLKPQHLLMNEEYFHPWQGSYLQPFQTPLLRVWDWLSGSQPLRDIGMLCRAPNMQLDTAEARKPTLARHLDHREWIPGPYISFTTSPEAIEALALMRAKRGSQILTVIDPNTRVRKGLPVLDVAAEMDYYDIPDPYGRSKEYYINHFVCLWQVTEAEIIGNWDWDSLADNRDWYREIIIPTFEKFKVASWEKERTISTNNRIVSSASGVDSGLSIRGSHDIDDLPIAFDKLTGKPRSQFIFA